MEIKITDFDKKQFYYLPEQAKPGDAGWDLKAGIEKEIMIAPGDIKLIPTNVAIELPHGYEAQIRSRSGLALNNGIFVLNSPGTIDSGYRGGIGVILANFGKVPFIVTPGMKIAQMVISEYTIADLIHVGELNSSERGEKGFGSTGM